MNSIIAYRNPWEQFLWESGIAYVGLGIIGLFILGLLGIYAFLAWHDWRAGR